MKKWDKKNSVIALLCAVLLGFVAVILFAEKLEILFHQWQHPEVVDNVYSGGEVAPPTLDSAQLPPERGKPDDADGNAGFFDEGIAWQRDTPKAIKKVLSAYLGSEEGSRFQFATDRRETESVVVRGSFSGLNRSMGSGNDELAVVLTEKGSDIPDQERILVVGYDSSKARSFILYNKVFDGAKIVLLKHSAPHALPPEAVSLRRFVTSNKQLLEVRTDSGERCYLYYDEEFDAMRSMSFMQDGAIAQ